MEDVKVTEDQAKAVWLAFMDSAAGRAIAEFNGISAGWPEPYDRIAIGAFLAETARAIHWQSIEAAGIPSSGERRVFEWRAGQWSDRPAGSLVASPETPR